MQFLASMHILLTCSFVLVLAYLLSILFSYLASSVIHGSSPNQTTRRRPSSSRRSPSTIEREQSISSEDALMYRLQEEDDEVEDADVTNAETPAAARDISIFEEEPMGRDDDYARQLHDGIEVEDNYKQGSPDDQSQRVGRPHGDKEGIMGNGELDVADVKGSYIRDAEYKDCENGSSWDVTKGDQSNVKESSDSSGSGSGSKLDDAQGSSSLQQRLPPTWSDLERMVNMNSMKRSSISTEPPLDED